MSVTKKIIIGITSFLAILLMLNIGLNFWLTHRLPQIIKKNNSTAYHIKYDKLKIDLLPATIYISDLVVIPKTDPKDSKKKIGLSAVTKKITINHFNIWHFLFHDKIKAQSISIEKPDVILYKKDKNSNEIRKNVVAPFEKTIVVSNIYIKKGKLDVVNVQDNQTILSTRNITTKIEGILINDQVLKRPIPFLYDDYSISCDSLFYKPNEFYTVKVLNLKTTNTGLHLKNLEYIPFYSRSEFVKKLDKEKDLFTITANSLDINKINWGFKDELFYMNAEAIVLNKVDALIYRNKIPEDDLSKKPLYNALLREIEFPLNIDTLSIRNSKIVYEEEINFEKGPATLTFDQFNLNALHIQSGFGLKKVADVDIKIQCRFMKDSALKVHWIFNTLDLKDGFTIKGNIQNFDISAMKEFTKPYVNAAFDGIFDTFNFTINGNDKNAFGTANLKYKDLDVTFYKKKSPQRESKIKSAVANLLLKKDSDDQLAKTDIELERIQEKSFYNFLWRSIAESLKKILI